MLRKEELIYEIGIRGVLLDSSNKVDELRRKLIELMEAEKDGVELEDALMPIDMDGEIAILESKLSDIELGMDDIKDKGTHSPLRMRTYLSHVNRRLVRLFTYKECKGEQREVVKNLMRTLKGLVLEFRSLGTTPPYAASSVMSVSAKLDLGTVKAYGGQNAPSITELSDIGNRNEGGIQREDRSVVGGDESSRVGGHIGVSRQSVRPVQVDPPQARQLAQEPTCVSQRAHFTQPPHAVGLTQTPTPRQAPNESLDNSSSRRQRDIHFDKWNISFSGTGAYSVMSFIMDVEEKALSKEVDFNLLVLGAPEFFKGRAKIWFRTIRDRIDSWNELKIALRKEFLPLNYAENLWDEIRARVQGTDELMGEYVTNMLALFERLETVERVEEDKKLNIIRKNLSPYYTDKLALTRVYSIEDLKDLRKQIEVSRYRMDYYGGNKEKQKKESEFANKSVKAKRFSVSEVQPSGSINQIDARVASRGKGCWKCGEFDHKFQTCPEKQNGTFCYKCGRPNVTVKTCPTCKTDTQSKVHCEGEESQDLSRTGQVLLLSRSPTLRILGKFRKRKMVGYFFKLRFTGNSIWDYGCGNVRFDCRREELGSFTGTRFKAITDDSYYGENR